MPDQAPTPLEVLTLAALSDEPRYGYLIASRIEALSDGQVQVRPGNLYRVLDRLQGQGWIEPADPPGDDSPDERRRYYRATPEGRRVASVQLAMFARVLRVTPGLGQESRP